MTKFHVILILIAISNLIISHKMVKNDQICHNFFEVYLAKMYTVLNLSLTFMIMNPSIVNNLFIL